MNKEQAYSRIEKHYRESQEKLVKFYSRSFDNEARAEDVIQEAYTRALTYWHTMPEAEEEFYPWFQTIISNCIRSNWREENNQGMGLNPEDQPEPVQKPAAIPAVLLRQVEDRINLKTPNVARVLKLFLFEQLRPKEIEQVVDENANHIRQMVFQFRKELKDEFGWVF